MESKWVWMFLAMLVMLGGWSDGCLEQEKMALLHLKPFFNYLDGLDSWGEGEKYSPNCCEWEGVHCNSTTGRVIRLFLNLSTTETYSDLPDLVLDTVGISRGPTRYLNASLFLPFEELKSLYLQGNSIAGCVHNGGFEKLSSKLDKLELLDLSANNLDDSILPTLSGLSSLKSLYLGGNQFTNSNPNNGISMLSKLINLEILDLHDNILRNDILMHLKGFISLKSLRLQNCGLKGTVDIRELIKLKNLKKLYLGENRIENLESFKEKGQLRSIKLEVLGLSYNLFNNSVFSFLGALSKLKYLYIIRNRLNGPIDIKEINALSNLQELNMWGNEVNGFAPSQDNKTELRLMNLKVLDLTYNLFNNNIFTSLARLSNLKSLFLGGDNLKEFNITELEALSSLKEMYIICSYDEDKAYKVENTTCSLPLQSLSLFPSLETLSLVGFSLNGSITAGKLHNFTNLENLFLEDSFLQTNSLREITSLKRLYFYGCRINNGSQTPQECKNLRSLEELTVEYSSLPSNFIQDIGTLTSLKKLEAYGCEVNYSLSIMNGPIHLKNLQYIEIDSTPVENNFLQTIGAMPSLKTLILRNCGLNGSLPAQGFCESVHLRELDISSNNLKGNLPNCFSNFTSLERLDLSSNQISGNVSSLEGLTSLRELELSHNYFLIPSTLRPFFNLSNLKHIFVENNSIYTETEMCSLAPRFQLERISLSCCGDGGSFPQFLYHQHDLQYVDLSNIKFIGEFPSWLLENNTKLSWLLLSNNSLSGPFSLPFASHSVLCKLDVSHNRFSGSIPIEIGAKLPSLWFLNMSKSSFNGSIPSSFGDMSLLDTLDLSNNQLSGGIPKHLAMGCSSLEVLKISSNKLQGHIFSTNFNLTYLRVLRVNENNFFGRIPDCLSNCSLLSALDASNNKLSGEIPRWMESMSHLSILDISNNTFVGGIPRWMGNMSSLEAIVMANNQLQGPIPDEFCQLNLNLKFLDLSANNISGSLPSCFSPLRINHVHLSRNKLHGPLTNAFRNSSILVTLDLSNNHFSGNIPDWIGKLFQLSYLLLNNNHFKGRIPLQICKLSNLSLIDLSHNNLVGSVPPCLKITTLNNVSQDHVGYVGSIVAQAPTSSFSTEAPIEFTTKSISYSYKGRILMYLSGIDLSYNKLTGEIPCNVVNFLNIIVLNLGHNNLTGSIPSELSNLIHLESLDLSYNNLIGKIPPQLAGLDFLGYFNVSYNNLSGEIPETGHVATFGDSSYLGNPLICGTLLRHKCSPIVPPSVDNSEDDGPINMDDFYVSFVVSYVMVLLTIAVVLYINPYWRRAWFYYIERVTIACYYFLADNLPKRFHCGNL